MPRAKFKFSSPDEALETLVADISELHEQFVDLQQKHLELQKQMLACMQKMGSPGKIEIPAPVVNVAAPKVSVAAPEVNIQPVLNGPQAPRRWEISHQYNRDGDLVKTVAVAK
jgi:hypothetical protein